MTVPEISPLSSATEIMQALSAREVSSSDLVDLLLARIERHNGNVNAIVTLDEEAARAAASAADAQRADGDARPLLGLPVTIKDCIDVLGLPTTGGLRERADHVAARDAPAVVRLREAGAIFLGKTNVPAYASDWQADNSLFGRSNNPWNPLRTPGGSTGGGAAAVAAGLSPLELGGDFCGSIRIPAAFCGIVGHKPSVSLVPGTGHFPAGYLSNAAMPISVLGPLARNADDLVLALDVLAAPQPDEDIGWRVHMPPPRGQRLSDFRVAVMPSLGWQPVDAEIETALDGFIQALRHAGAAVTEVMPNGLGDMRDFFHAYMAVISAISSLRSTADERHWQAERCRALDDEMLHAWADGLTLSAQGYIELMQKRAEYRDSFSEFFKGYDVLLAPANIVNAYEHMDAPFPDRLMDEHCVLTVNGSPVTYDRQCVYASPANFSGLPATAFPIGMSADGLPIGLQAIGPNLEDRTTIAFAQAVQNEVYGFVPPPIYSV